MSSIPQDVASAIANHEAQEPIAVTSHIVPAWEVDGAAPVRTWGEAMAAVRHASEVARGPVVCRVLSVRALETPRGLIEIGPNGGLMVSVRCDKFGDESDPVVVEAYTPQLWSARGVEQRFPT